MAEALTTNSVGGKQPVPEWISETLFEKVLKEYKKDESIKIRKFKSAFKTQWGEGYASVMVRVHVDYESTATGSAESGIYLVKFPFDEKSFAAKLLREFDIFNQEIVMYEKHLPDIRRTLKDAGLPYDFYPETLGVSREHSAIIFEDLQTKSFKLPEADDRLDLVQTELVLDKLALMHAASAKINLQNPGVYKDMDRGLHNRHCNGFDTFYTDCLNNCIRVASKWKGYEKYVEKMKKIKPELMERSRRCYDAKPHFFNVLAHGDMWLNNVMFKTDKNGRLIDVKIFDFQYSVYTSPIMDLMLFVKASCKDELRFGKWKELVEYYYHQLKENLEKLSYEGKIPTFEDIWHQYEEDSFYCFVVLCLDTIFGSIDPADEGDLECMMGSSEKGYNYRQKLYDNPEFQEELKVYLPYLDLHGILDL